jgi:hypothetical protein
MVEGSGVEWQACSARLVGVEKEQNDVRMLRKPTRDGHKVVAPV